MKYCVIRKVPFKTSGKKPRIVWAHVLSESEGLALVLVPKPDFDQPHSVFIAQENVADRVFEAVGHFGFNLTTEDVVEAADKLRMEVPEEFDPM
jgi:hypothetical protein